MNHRLIARFVFAAALTAVVSGCATWSTGQVDTTNASQAGGPVTPTVPAQIRLTDGDLADQPYTSLGDITVQVNKTTVFHPNPTKELVNVALQERAAQLGADAVIHVRYGEGGISLMSWGSLEGKGRAVKFVK